jgi:hypothetical protein
MRPGQRRNTVNFALDGKGLTEDGKRHKAIQQQNHRDGDIDG